VTAGQSQNLVNFCKTAWCNIQQDSDLLSAKQLEYNICNLYTGGDRLCGLVVRVPGYRSRGPGFLRSSGSGTGSTQPRECN
jgi:hypothetical protein